MFQCRRSRLIMALKIGFCVALVLILIALTSSHTPASDPHLQKATAERYLPVDENKIEAIKDDSLKSCTNCDRDSANALHLAVVACGDRMPETIILLKSAVMFSLPSTRFHFHVFTESELQPQFRDALESWPSFVRQRFTYSLRSITYPETEDFQKWKVLFKPCASQRLFFPQILTDLDLLLYVDTDILFLKPVTDIWGHFSKFNSSQLAALAPEHEEKAMGWYNRFAQHPYYGELGVNSGVMLMHLDRMRTASWEKKMIAYQETFEKKIVWGDQDLINVYFSYFPEKLFVYPCEWNYRPDHCMYGQTCHTAVEEGVAVLHGNRRAFHNDKQPAFKAVYNAISDYDFQAGEPQKDLILRIKNDLKALAPNYCAAHANTLLKSLVVSVENIPKP